MTMVSREAVLAAYRWLLGREPENELAVEYHMEHPDEAALRREILRSAEFAALYRQGDDDLERISAERSLLPAGHIETEAEGEQARRLWERVAASWDALGQSRAHWSVLTFDAFDAGRIEENRAAFEATAEIDARLVEAALARFPEVDAKALDCIEIGCGVGRATRALARRFRRVHGLDVSAPHLEIARAELAAAGAGNVTLTRIGAIGDYATLEPAGFLFTRIVLQHNPPPVQAAILRTVLGRLEPGAIALFQVVTRIDGYRYSVAEDLASPEGSMEMHVLPQATVFAILAETGMRAVEVQADVSAGLDPSLGSHLFLARKL